MSLSFTEVEYLGGAQVFPTNFALGILEIEHIKVTSLTNVDGLGDPLVYEFSYNTSNGDVTVLDTLDMNEQIRIARIVPKTSLYVEFISSDITPRNVDNTIKQALMAVHEVVDQEETNRGIAQNALDIATDLEATIDTSVNAAVTAANTAVNARDTAVASASSAVTSANNAASSATSAAGSATNAASSATSASGSASTATSAASSATGSATLAADWAEKPDGQDVQGVGTRSAKHHAGVATTAANTATTKANEASTSASHAASSASAASTSATNAGNSASSASTSASEAANSALAAAAYDPANLVGQMAYFPFATPPVGWLKRNGAAISRTTYAALFDKIGTMYGEGDGSTTFNLPDDRGEFERAWDDGRGVDAGRALGSTQVQRLADHEHNLPTGWDSGNVQYNWSDASGNPVYGSTVVSGAASRNISMGGATSRTIRHGHTSGTQRTSGENRPRNRAYLACIRY